MAALREDFRRNGYAHLPREQARIDLARLEREFSALARLAEDKLAGSPEGEAACRDSGLIVVPESGDPRQLCRIEYIAGASPYIRTGLVTRLAAWIETLVGEPVTLFKDKCNVKNPGGGGFPAHQDIPAYYGFGTRYHVTAAVMLDPALPSNGGLEMAPGLEAAPEGTQVEDTPRGPLAVLPHYAGGRRNGDIVDELSARMTWTPVEAAAGDVLFFDSYVPHRSHANRSDATRRILFFTFNLAGEGSGTKHIIGRSGKIRTTRSSTSPPPRCTAAWTPPPRSGGRWTPDRGTERDAPRAPPVHPRTALHVASGPGRRRRGPRLAHPAAVALTARLRAMIAAVAGSGDACSVVPLQGSGTFAVEAMLCSVPDAEDHLLIVENGAYSARMTEICAVHGIRHSVLRCDHTRSFDLARVEARLLELGDVTHVAAVHFETALGVLNDIDGLGALAARHGARLLVDAISTFGALPLDVTSGRLAAVALSANKCLHGLPGLSFVIADRATLARPSRPRTLSLDLRAQHRSFEADGQWRFTPPLQAMLALEQAIREYEAAGDGRPASAVTPLSPTGWCAAWRRSASCR
ncbi:aminotransferase class V-fold PLP-dependent enzyme [Azospirillum thermophilum]|uniref:aminotransferase class V-fold PLP-dependent enzyme n=1 Tax=Azospirillum thermophilum TaxID=2202148 RepID=UPI001FE85E02|nr:aminotransferase class V-fold PLP-dependent enzyme [Azospirillum thermophilum]